MISAIIVEDEPLAAEKLVFLLKDFPGIRIDGVFSDAGTALSWLQTHTPDLLFLDIQLPGLSGMELARALPEPSPALIFTTAFDSFAVEAFDVNTVGYLLKPFDRHRLIAVVLKALKKIRPNAAPADRDVYPVKSGGKIRLIPLKDLLWVQSDHNEVKVGTTGGILIQRSTLTAMEESLPAGDYLRVHKSFLIRKEAVKEIEPLPNGEFILTLSTGKKIPTGRTYRPVLSGLPGIPEV
ncbi:MAG: LytTR family DNA-binding domain-containing protein [Bacteroidetes bacterium]|nr:LytTR family DNA-binding domain-containing protein [Bacteroidota bacterium]